MQSKFIFLFDFFALIVTMNRTFFRLLNEMQTTKALTNGNYLMQSRLDGTLGDHMLFDDDENYVIKHFETIDVSAHDNFRGPNKANNQF